MCHAFVGLLLNSHFVVFLLKFNIKKVFLQNCGDFVESLLTWLPLISASTSHVLVFNISSFALVRN